MKTAVASGKRFLFRSAASLFTALAQLPPQLVAASAMRQYVRNGKPGAVIIGSHVNKTTAQLNKLLKEPSIVAIEVDVDHIATERSALLQEILHQAARLVFGEQVSAFLMDVVRGLPTTLGFLISKGSITSNDVLSHGLALKVSRVLGQLLPGCSVVRCPSDTRATLRCWW
ncbi:MAG: putative nucleotide-binding of sugar-metabolising enzyme [Candidatus Nitrotoga sp. SPKER]|nr:MAG: putative nucleotide-binding of sugar-metabolising enzyme [Candidatus Nitrotoga sp. SPKER]